MSSCAPICRELPASSLPCETERVPAFSPARKALVQIRPCFLVVDSEHASSISTRKLVLETAKYNVITVYSCEEATRTLERFPLVHAIVINGIMQDGCASSFLESASRMPGIKLVVVGEGPMAEGPREPDAIVESFAPPKLLEALQRLFPKEAKRLLDHENELAQKQI